MALHLGCLNIYVVYQCLVETEVSERTWLHVLLTGAPLGNRAQYLMLLWMNLGGVRWCDLTGGCWSQKLSPGGSTHTACCEISLLDLVDLISVTLYAL